MYDNSNKPSTNDRSNNKWDRESRLVLFYLLMRKELEANSHKGDWRYVNEEQGLEEIKKHTEKLQKALADGNIAAAVEYAADIANSALFVANALGAVGGKPPKYEPRSISDSY